MSRSMLGRRIAHTLKSQTLTSSQIVPVATRCHQSSNAAIWKEEDVKYSPPPTAAAQELDSIIRIDANTTLVHIENSSRKTRPPTGGRRPRLEALRLKLMEDGTSRPLDFASPPTGEKGRDVHAGYGAGGGQYDQGKNQQLIMNKEESLQQLMEELENLPVPQDPLTDRFGRDHSYLRISLAERCNLRCLYCMPEDGVPLQPAENLLSNSEILKLATFFHQHGVNKVRLTGGEPLLRKDLVSLVADLNRLDLEQIGMTTNGVTLSKHLPDLVESGMTHINISLDSLDADKFARLTRRPPAYHDRVMAAIDDCTRYLPGRTKINCVVMPDNVNELDAFCELTRHMPIDIRFIEYMPFNENQWQTGGFVSYQQMQNQIGGGLVREQDGPNDTTKWWRLQGDSGTIQGRIGFITSMSEHFCGTCNRLRLTADGQLKVCLFGKTEVSLRDLMRNGGSDEMLQKVIHYSVQRKHFKLGGHKDMQDLQAHSTENRPMTLIGG
jgi:molybdenum cofactor biosynthesis protein A